VSAVPFELTEIDQFPIGGRLRHFVSFWRTLEPTKHVIQTVLGAPIPFTSEPVQTSKAREYKLCAQDHALVEKEVLWMLDQKIITPVTPSETQIVSPFFLATNKDGTKRPILNVKEINKNNLPKLHFKMETLTLVLPLIKRGEWFTSWDVRKGFFNIAIHPNFRHFFCFEFDGVRYQYNCLVMGLSIAPLFFSKLMACLVQLARSWGIKVSYYLDDTLIRAPEPVKGRIDTQVFGSLLQLAGFLLHKTKSVQEPTQVIEYLGFIINSRDMTLSLPPKKSSRILKLLRKAVVHVNTQKTISIRDAAKLIGLLVSSTMATKYGRAHYRVLEDAKLRALQAHDFNFNAPFQWPKECLDDLQWWIKQLHNCTTSFEEPQPTTTVTTDASLEGWGVIWEEKQAFGGWEKEETRIDALELKTVLFALQIFPVAQRHKVISVRCDNTVAVAYLNNMGGRIPRLDRIARRIWHHLESHDAFIVATYIATDVNPADALTRGLVSRAQIRDVEVQLNPQLFAQIKLRGPFSPVIDWFASSLNYQLPRFYVWREVSRSMAEGTDAFSYHWGHECGYMFPPFSLLPRVIRKIVQDGAQVLLVHPLWNGALWSPSLDEITLMRETLDSSANVLRYPENPNLRHPMTDLQLAASWVDGRSLTPPSGRRFRQR
jgi:hypothetical protein